MPNDILKGYAAAADAAFIDRLEAISSATLLAPMSVHFPQDRSRILDIGAGTGRDAAWLAGHGHQITAVEPVDALRTAGSTRHTSPKITWLSDTLPHLCRVTATGQSFDVILLSAVWQHLTEAERQTALPALRGLLAERGKIIISIRHGAGAPARRTYPANIPDLINRAEALGLAVLAQTPAPSIQPRNRNSGVTWTWLVLGHVPT